MAAMRLGRDIVVTSSASTLGIVVRLTQLCNVAEWIMTHTDVAHLFKVTEGEQRISMCGRLFAVNPGVKVEDRCQWCMRFYNRMEVHPGAIE